MTERPRPWSHPFWQSKCGRESKSRLKWFSVVAFLAGIVFLSTLFIDALGIDPLPMGGAALLSLILLMFEVGMVNTDKLRFEFETWKVEHG